MKANRAVVASVGIMLTLLVGILLLAGSGSTPNSARKFPKGTPTSSRTVILPAKGTPPTSTPTRTPTLTATDTLIPTDTPTPVDTVSITDTPTDVVETFTPTPTNTVVATPTPTLVPPSNVAPYPSAPLCEGHDNNTFHGLWNYAEGCHYDHEHGQNPFTPQVAATFPEFDLFELLGGVGIGHTNPSGPMENTHKHGGFKWTVSIAPFSLPAPSTCVVGFENAQNCVTAAVIQYHQYGDANLELEVHDGARIHSANALIRMGSLADPGYAYVVQHIEYGEIAASYQGALVPYPENFLPSWNPAFGQYWTTPCIGSFFNIVQSNCLSSLEAVRAGDADNIVTSKVTSNVLPVGPRPPGSELFKLLWRARDAYQALDAREALTYPLTYLWICSNDGGETYNPVGCRYNNSTGRVHEIGGTIPASWDNLSGFDSDARFGRITADGFVTRFGTLNLGCVVAGPDCFPVKLVSAYVGTYGGTLSSVKISDTNPSNTPERDIYFCNGVVCSETSPGAVPSGWILDEN